MTDKPAAEFGSYVDAKFMRGLKVMRVMVDIPIERSNEFIRMFGAPDGANPVPVVIARVDPNATVAEPLSGVSPAEGPNAAIAVVAPQELRETRKKGFAEMTRAQQAGFLCTLPEFRAWVARRLCAEQVTSVQAAEYVRTECVVSSRSDLDDPECAASHPLWDRLRDTYIVESKWGVS